MSKQMWDTSSIEGMEATSKSEATGDCNKQLYGQCLEVTYIEPGKWNYKWGKNFVSREAAENLLKYLNS